MSTNTTNNIANTSYAVLNNVKKASFSVAQGIGAVVALVITVVCAVLMLISKAGTYFIPKPLSKKIDALQEGGCELIAKTAMFTLLLSYGVVGEFQNLETRVAMERKIINMFEGNFGRLNESLSSFIHNFAYAHRGSSEE